MIFKKLIKHFDCHSYQTIGRKLGIPHSNLNYYKKHGLPAGRQAIIEIQTDKKRKADLTSINEE